MIALLAVVLYRRTGSLSTRKKGNNDQVPADFGNGSTQRSDIDENRVNGMREVHELHDTCPFPKELQGDLVPHGREFEGSLVPYRRELEGKPIPYRREIL